MGVLDQGGITRRQQPLLAALAAMIAVSLAVQAWLVFAQPFNWDEFYFLGLVHDYQRGELDKALQTIHVHPFALLAILGGDEIDQLIAGRLTMLGLECLTLACLYRLARTWAGRAPALLAVAAYAAMPWTLEHGASFRADPLALAPAVAALALLAAAPLRPAAIGAIGLLLAIAALATVKVIFFAPAFAGIAAWRVAASADPRQAIVRVAAVGAIAALAFAVLYLLHQATLPAAGLARSGEMVAHAGRTTVWEAGFFPRRAFALRALAGAPIQAMLLLLSLVAAGAALAPSEPRDRWLSLAVLLCVAPLGCLLFYRNAFPYFFPFIAAPAFVAVAWLAEQRQWHPAMLGFLAAAMAATAVPAIARMAPHDPGAQRSVIRAVHQIFPRPVPYIDRDSMIATFPKRGFFMSTWGMLEYRRHGPQFAPILAREPVPLLVLNSPALEQAVGARRGLPDAMTLHEVDAELLRDNYIAHWGALWVAGKRIPPVPGATSMIVLVPGTYTLEGGAVTLDGRELRPGDSVELGRGPHRVAAERIGEAVLRWGNHLPRPSATAPTEPLFDGF